MTAISSLTEFAANRMIVVPLTVEQYHSMIKQGILAEGSPIELIDGFLIRKDRSKAGEDIMTVGHEHVWAVGQLMRLMEQIEKLGGHLQIQQPVTLSPDSEPEPDASICFGPIERYRGRNVASADLTCVVEVADSSLAYDRSTKQRIYADHGIGQYVIVNLVDGVVEDYRQPAKGTGKYQSMLTLRRGQTVRLSVGADGALEVSVDSLLP